MSGFDPLGHFAFEFHKAIRVAKYLAESEADERRAQWEDDQAERHHQMQSDFRNAD